VDIVQYDPNITIEGAATALGVVGAAIGYLLNLRRNWSSSRNGRLNLGTRLCILDILEQHLQLGASESEIITAYQSSEFLTKRLEYGGWKPNDLDKIRYERFLKQLQNDFLIDLVGKDRYKMRVKPVSKYDIRESTESIVSDHIQTVTTIDNLQKILKEYLEDSSHGYRRKRAAELLLRTGDKKTIEEIVKLCDGEDAELRLEIAELLIEHMPVKSIS